MRGFAWILAMVLALAVPIASARVIHPGLSLTPSAPELALPSFHGLESLQGIQDEPSKSPPVDIDVKVQKDNGSGLPVSPVWLAIGGLGLLVLIVLIVMAVRGGKSDTTVVRG